MVAGDARRWLDENDPYSRKGQSGIRFITYDDGGANRFMPWEAKGDTENRGEEVPDEWSGIIPREVLDAEWEVPKILRKPIPLWMRAAIYRAAGHRCVYCKHGPPYRKLHIDHVVALANGGADEPENMVAACADCNLTKKARRIFWMEDIAFEHIATRGPIEPRSKTNVGATASL